jgi:hypothetical protein
VRLDASLERTRLHFIETNADMPHGAGHNDAILDSFEGTDVYRRFGEEYGLRPLRIQEHQLRALLGTCSEWGGTGNGDSPSTFVHRVVLTGECLERADDVRPITAAVRARAVYMVNPFRSELLGHKAIFALLTDTGKGLRMDAAEREAIRDHVPWARQVVAGRTTDPGGAEVDLVENLRDRREHLVLKPAHDFGGHGVA